MLVKLHLRRWREGPARSKKQGVGTVCQCQGKGRHEVEEKRETLWWSIMMEYIVCPALSPCARWHLSPSLITDFLNSSVRCSLWSMQMPHQQTIDYFTAATTEAGQLKRLEIFAFTAHHSTEVPLQRERITFGALLLWRQYSLCVFKQQITLTTCEHNETMAEVHRICSTLIASGLGTRLIPLPQTQLAVFIA